MDTIREEFINKRVSYRIGDNVLLRAGALVGSVAKILQ